MARHRILQLAALAVIVFGPIASAAWKIHVARPGYVEVDPGTAEGHAAESVRAYLAGRNPILDRLLPDGTGGTRFFEDLDGNAGMAFVQASAIGISSTVGGWGWPEATELHERAHLLYASLPQEVSRLLVRLPAPAPREYAATNAGEHFAEMTGTAWKVIVEPESMCVDDAPLERLRDAERRVPGTAGVVSWYLRHLGQDDVEGYEAISRTAAMLAAPYRAESDAVWKAVENRRLPSGGFQPWEPPSVHEYLEGLRAQAGASTRWIDRIEGYLLAPSLLVLSIAG